MKKYIFWGVPFKNHIVALNQDLSRYALGETFWQAMRNLCETLPEWIPASSGEESDINTRLRMYHETGINKVELFLEDGGKRFAVQCSNSRSFIQAESEREALLKYVDTRARTSKVNTGDID